MTGQLPPEVEALVPSQFARDAAADWYKGQNEDITVICDLRDGKLYRQPKDGTAGVGTLRRGRR